MTPEMRGEGNCVISRDKLRTGEIPSCAQAVEGSDNYRGDARVARGGRYFEF